MAKNNSEQILQNIFNCAESKRQFPAIDNEIIQEYVAYVCRCMSNRSGVRLLMSCLLAKIDDPTVDPRKPYTEIGTSDSFSGRTYDERYITDFIKKHRLPCNATTAFLTPTLRNISKPLTTDVDLIGRPRDLYVKTLQLLDYVATNKFSAEDIFVETVRVLLNIRDEKLSRMASLLDALGRSEGALPLSSESILILVSQHLACKNASRLPVLIVAAAYKVAGNVLGERVLPFNAHNAADLQTGSVGDLEICLISDDAIVTVYEMKTNRVTINDIDIAVEKIARSSSRIHNYIFITTDKINLEVSEYAFKFYEETGGTEIVILDCINFLRHFLHFFHRLRSEYLNVYQDLVINEPDSAVGQTLKEAFLALRQSAESEE